MMRHLRIPATLIVLVIFSLLAAGCGGDGGANPADDATTQYPNGRILVTAEWLAEQLDDPDVVILDMRSGDDYEEAHVPGAFNVRVSNISSTIDDVSLEFDEEEVTETLRDVGLEKDDTVVIYDDLGMMSSGRLFWTLEYVGHEDVRVLHGGWNAWQAVGGETSSDAPEVAASDYTLELQPDLLVTAEEVLAALEDPAVTLVDARSPQEYTGEKVIDDRGGHIPGAVNLVWLDTLTGGDTRYAVEDGWQEELRDEDVEWFKDTAELALLLQDTGIDKEDRIITYCQTLWRGAHIYFVLRLMGYEDVAGYDGSWDEWASNPDLPVVEGAEG